MGREFLPQARAGRKTSLPGGARRVLDVFAATVRDRLYSAQMQSAVRLATSSAFAVDAVTCTDDHVRWSAPQVEPDYELVLVRRGRFQRRAGGVAEDIDPTMAYLSVSGEEEHFAHPTGGDLGPSVAWPPAV